VGRLSPRVFLIFFFSFFLFTVRANAYAERIDNVRACLPCCPPREPAVFAKSAISYVRVFSTPSPLHYVAYARPDAAAAARVYNPTETCCSVRARARVCNKNTRTIKRNGNDDGGGGGGRTDGVCVRVRIKYSNEIGDHVHSVRFKNHGPSLPLNSNVQK